MKNKGLASLDLEINKRFIEALEFIKKNENLLQQDIAELINVHKVTLTRVNSGTNNASTDLIYKLCKKFNYINLDYILQGNGTITVNSSAINSPNVSYKSDSATIQQTQTNKTLAIYDLDETAGSLILRDNVITNPSQTISYHGTEQCDYAIRVYGESNAGKITNGGVILVKETYDFEVIPFGQLFLIETSDYHLVRYVKKSGQGNEYIKLTAHNPIFDEFDLHRSKIKRLFLIKKIINNEA